MTSSSPDAPRPEKSRHPYADQPPSAFWRTGVAANPAAPRALYRPTWTLSSTDRVATAGSCFAQHIGRALRRAGVALLDVEPPPDALPTEQHARFGFGAYSARYGNLYTARQLRQLAEQAFGERLEDRKQHVLLAHRGGVLDLQLFSHGHKFSGRLGLQVT